MGVVNTQTGDGEPVIPATVYSHFECPECGEEHAVEGMMPRIVVECESCGYSFLVETERFK